MNIAVIFAGGIGKRMNSRALPKQFLKLYGKEIIIYTLEHFEDHEQIDKIVIACVEEWIPFLKELVEKYCLKKVAKIVPGGITGQDSIYAGLKAAEEIGDSENNIVLIHDGVRPLINEKIITECIECVRANKNAITVAPAIETIITLNEDKMIQNVLERSQCLMARAPQCFYLEDIMRAHENAIKAGKHDFIDSASMMRYYGHNLSVVEGPMENIKITTPMDFYTFKGLFEAREQSQLFGD
ncbi:2-C-methyl-D-erythritol 4-phosphate cytidylyltransferase [Bariatricus sp. HCP28S3_D3]|uniref:2-C-methyl-D-erythritol 4-phosphate cytidylyltransferase n=1 Tax=Bariatricus sp. HCP28S3_D3 TaxID=3438901 RepID=UPI003F8A3AD1